MMNLIRPTAPQYRGCASSPKPSSGLLSQLLCYVFGGGAPAYQGSGQPVAKACGLGLYPSEPVYKTPAVTTEPTEDPALDVSDEDAVDPEDYESAMNGSPTASDPIQAMGTITIVVG